MSITVLDLNLNQVPDMHPANPGQHTMSIIKGVFRVSEKGNPGLYLYFKVEDEDDCYSVRTWLTIPHGAATDENNLFFRRNLKQFALAARIEEETLSRIVTTCASAYDGEDLTFDDLNGVSLQAILTIEESNGIESNQIKRFV